MGSGLGMRLVMYSVQVVSSPDPLMFELAHSGSHSCVSGYHCHSRGGAGQDHCTKCSTLKSLGVCCLHGHETIQACPLSPAVFNTKYYCVPFFKINK